MHKRTTHLVCKRVIDAVGTPKYLRAMEWGIPVVSYHWILDSIKEGELQPTSNYKTDRWDDSADALSLECAALSRSRVPLQTLSRNRLPNAQEISKPGSQISPYSIHHASKIRSQHVGHNVQAMHAARSSAALTAEPHARPASNTHARHVNPSLQPSASRPQQPVQQNLQEEFSFGRPPQPRQPAAMLAPDAAAAPEDMEDSDDPDPTPGGTPEFSFAIGRKNTQEHIQRQPIFPPTATAARATQHHQAPNPPPFRPSASMFGSAPHSVTGSSRAMAARQAAHGTHGGNKDSGSDPDTPRLPDGPLQQYEQRCVAAAAGASATAVRHTGHTTMQQCRQAIEISPLPSGCEISKSGMSSPSLQEGLVTQVMCCMLTVWAVTILVSLACILDSIL